MPNLRRRLKKHRRMMLGRITLITMTRRSQQPRRRSRLGSKVIRPGRRSTI
jgi:hypothetical protein